MNRQVLRRGCPGASAVFAVPVPRGPTGAVRWPASFTEDDLSGSRFEYQFNHGVQYS